MPQYTLLTIVTDMLVATKSEGVTSIEDGDTTEEALLCVNLANQTYEELLGRFKWKHLKSFKNLTAGTYLNTLKGAAGDLFVDAYNIYYGAVNEEFKVHYVEPEDFIQRTLNRSSTDTNVTILNEIKVYKDQVPTFYTSFDDTELVFDSMPTVAGLVAGNALGLIYTYPLTRLTSNNDTFDLPSILQPYFKGLCIAEALEILADEDTKADKKRRFANKQIAKIAHAGNFVEKLDDAFKHLKVRGSNWMSRNITGTIEV